MVCSLEDFGKAVREETHRLALLYVRTESKIAFPENLYQHPRMLTSPLCSILPVIAAGKSMAYSSSALQHFWPMACVF